MATFSRIQNRDDFTDYCLRRLGHPVIEINVDDEQIEDRINDALELFMEYTSEGSHRVYLPMTITADMRTRGYIDFDLDTHTLPNNANDILSIVRVLPVSNNSSSVNFFDVKYQMRLNDIWDMQSGGFTGFAYYEQMQQHLSLLDMKLSGIPEITHDRQGNRLYFYLSSEKLSVGDYIVAEVYGIRTPDSTTEYNSLWNHKFLKEYTTAIIKRQWGTNLLKFDGMTLPGGVQINGRSIFEDANNELEQIRTRFREEEDVGPVFFVG